jgi:hypothetical protein
VGIDENMVEKYLNSENISDAYLDNLKNRLGIKDPKPERVKRNTVVNDKKEEESNGVKQP